MVSNHVLFGINQNDINNELRFLVASARVDGETLMSLTFSPEVAEKQKQYAVRSLRILKREGIIEFFVLSEELDTDSTTAVFLINKYGEYIDTGADSIYVKI